MFNCTYGKIYMKDWEKYTIESSRFFLIFDFEIQKEFLFPQNHFLRFLASFHGIRRFRIFDSYSGESCFFFKKSIVRVSRFDNT